MEKTLFPRNPWWIALVALICTTIGNGAILTFSFGVFAQPLLTEFKIGRGDLGAFFFAQAMLQAIAAPILGALIDRYGTRPVMLPWIAAFGLLLILTATASSFALFASFFLVLGIASAASGPIGVSKAISFRISSRLGLALGIAAAGSGLGAALLPQIARLVIAEYGWRGGYIVFGLIELLILFPLVAIFIRSVGSKDAASAAVKADLSGDTVMEVIRTPLFWKLAVVVSLTGMVVTGINVSMVPLLTDRGFSLAAATSVLSTVGISIIVGRVFAGYLLDRFFGPYVGIAFFVLPIPAIVLLNTTTAPFVPFVCAAFVGLATGAEIDIIAYLTRRYFGERSYGQFYGYFLAIFFASTGLGPFLMGASFQGLATYLVAEIGFVAALLVACILMARLGPYRYQPAKHS
jgi:predicted MFS family arabinose efflux permease